MKKILVFLAEGFEEIEAVTCIDVLRRADIEVITVSLNNIDVKGSHNIIVRADKTIKEIEANEVNKLNGVILPGGMPGASNLRDNEKVINIVKQLSEGGQLVAAICAAPIVLEKAGVISGKNATSYPGFNTQMSSCNYRNDRIIIDGNIITGKGPGVAMEFSLAVVEYLMGENRASELREGMII